MTTFARGANTGPIGRGILAALVLGFHAACGQPELPADHYYRLQPAAPAPLAQPILKGTVEIGRFAADGVVAGRPIVYTEPGQPHQVKEYHYHFWTEPPTLLLRDHLIGYLRAARAAGTVTTPDMRAASDYQIAGRIIRLEKVEGSSPKGVLEIELGVRSNAGKIVLLEVYKVEIAASNNSVDAAVRALNAALDKAYAQFAADLARK